MPLSANERKIVLDYTRNHIKKDMEWYTDFFSFIKDDELRNHLALAFYNARFQAKLMEALKLEKEELVYFCKNQVILYASIYEAIIDYVLFDLLNEEPDVQQLLELKDFVRVEAVHDDVKISKGTEKLFLCKQKVVKQKPYQVKFEDRIGLFEKLGIIDDKLRSEIQGFYDTRNTIHIMKESQLKKRVTIDESKNSYWRLEPFTDGIKYFLKERGIA